MFAFDLLFLDGADIRNLPLIERREKLRQLLPIDPRGVIHFSDHFDGDGGGQYVASGGPGSSGKVTGFDGEAPKSRVVIVKWDSLDKIQAWHSSPEFQENRKIGDKYAKFRSFAVDGVPQ